MSLRRPPALFRIWDVVLIVLLLLLVALTLYFSLAPRSGGEAEVYLNGDLVATMPLTQEGEWICDHLKVVVSNGTVRVVDADCPDKICMKRGEISRAGESIVCLPNRVVVVISGKGEVEAIS